jgi:PilZ domain
VLPIETPGVSVTDTSQIAVNQTTYTRRWWRYTANVPICVIVRGADKTTIVHGRAFSLSSGGIGMFAGAELNCGDQMAVEFTPAYSMPPIRVDGKICYRDGYNYGVEFVAENSGQKQEVAQFCRHLSSLVASHPDTA